MIKAQSESKQKEIESYIQAFHGDMEEILDHRKRDRNDYLLELQSISKLIEELIKHKNESGKALLSIATIVRFSE